MNKDRVRATETKGYTIDGWGNVISFVDYVTRNCGSSFQFGCGSQQASLRGCDIISLADRR